MSEIEEITIDIKNKLGVTTWVTDSHKNAHISINSKICDECPHRLCIAACPAKCFTIIDGRIAFQFEDCLECGTCDIICDKDSIDWRNPRGTYGVHYSMG